MAGGKILDRCGCLDGYTHLDVKWDRKLSGRRKAVGLLQRSRSSWVTGAAECADIEPLIVRHRWNAKKSSALAYV